MTTSPATTLVAILLMATAFVIAGGTTDPRSSGMPAASAQKSGYFTGEYIDGAPVYRLSPVTVIAHRKAELAKMEREENERARQARSKVGARPPA